MDRDCRLIARMDRCARQNGMLADSVLLRTSDEKGAESRFPVSEARIIEEFESQKGAGTECEYLIRRWVSLRKQRFFSVWVLLH